jgi:carbamoyl-phosphate synthase large subunit
MRRVNVLITGVGAPGTKGTLYSLNKNFDKRTIRTIGTDILDDVVGKYLCDRFYRIPEPSKESFIRTMLDICEKEKVDVILPQVTNELFKLSEFSEDFSKVGTKVAISSRNTIDVSNNKYTLMKKVQLSNLRRMAPKFFITRHIDDLRKRAEHLGFPEKPFVIKPAISSGMRGLRIVDNSVDSKHDLYNKKPDNVHIRLEELERTLGNSFPELVTMEYLPGNEYSVDILATDDPVVIPRRRDSIRTGITFNATVEKNEDIIKSSKELVRLLELKYACGFQIKSNEDGEPKIIECNPRIQGTMVLSTLAGANIVYGAVKLALGEEVPNFKVDWNTRLLRYWGGIGLIDGKVKDEIQ